MRDTRTGFEHDARLAGTGKIVGMETCHVDIGASWLPHRRCPVLSKSVDMPFQFPPAEPFDGRTSIAEALHKGIEFAPVLLTPDIERAALREEAVVAQVIARSQCQGDDFRSAVTLLPEGRRATGGVISRTLFCLEQQNARPALAQFGGQAGSGYSSSDDGEIVHGHWRGGATRSRKSAIALIALFRTAGTSRRIS